MANANSINLNKQLEGIYSQFQRTTPEQFQNAVEGRAERFSAFERTCLGAMYSAAQVSDQHAAFELYDAWCSVQPTDAQTDRELALWSWADASIESTLATVQ